MRTWYGALVALALSIGAQPAAAADFTIPVDGDFWEDEIRWKQMGNAYEYRWYVFERGGQLTICGAGKFVNAANRMQTVGLLRNGRLLLDGRPILKDLTFFTKVKANADLVGAKATCRDTGAKAGPDSTVSLEMSGRARF